MSLRASPLEGNICWAVASLMQGHDVQVGKVSARGNLQVRHASEYIAQGGFVEALQGRKVAFAKEDV